MIKNIIHGSDNGKDFYVQTCCDTEHIGNECSCRTIAENLSASDANKIAIEKSKELNVPIIYCGSPFSKCNKTSYWGEIRNDYIREEDDGFVVITIDAWKTDDDNEEGKIIADIIGKKVKGENVVFVNYRDYIALTDIYAQEKIKEAKIKLEEFLNKIKEE